MTDFRARGTIMGPAGLTAVFGMGTGVTPPVWSPEIRPAGGQAGRAVNAIAVFGRSRRTTRDRPAGSGSAADKASAAIGRACSRISTFRRPLRGDRSPGIRHGVPM